MAKKLCMLSNFDKIGNELAQHPQALMVLCSQGNRIVKKVAEGPSISDTVRSKQDLEDQIKSKILDLVTESN